MKLLTIVTGLVLGGIATASWQYLSKWFSDNAFWISCQELAKNLIQDPGGEDFFGRYVKLLRALGVYLGKMTCRVGLTVLPIVIALHFLSPVISKQQAENATSLVVYPKQDVKLSTAATTLAGAGDLHAWPCVDETGALTATTPNWTTEFGYEDPMIATSSEFAAVLYRSCGFQVTHHADAPSLLLIRPHAQDINPLWPLLNDFEFVFWTSMIFASAAMGMLIHRRPSKNRSTLRIPHQPTGNLVKDLS